MKAILKSSGLILILVFLGITIYAGSGNINIEKDYYDFANEKKANVILSTTGGYTYKNGSSKFTGQLEPSVLFIGKNTINIKGVSKKLNDSSIFVTFEPPPGNPSEKEIQASDSCTILDLIIEKFEVKAKLKNIPAMEYEISIQVNGKALPDIHSGVGAKITFSLDQYTPRTVFLMSRNAKTFSMKGKSLFTGDLSQHEPFGDIVIGDFLYGICKRNLTIKVY